MRWTLAANEENRYRVGTLNEVIAGLQGRHVILPHPLMGKAIAAYLGEVWPDMLLPQELAA
jgi:hypothetical protein